MINLLIPIIEKPKEYNESIAAIAGRKDVSIIVGTTRALEEKLSLPQSVKVRLFKDGSKKEEIINGLQDMLTSGSIIVARRPFGKTEFEKLAASPTQVTYLKKKQTGKVKEFFKKILSGIVKFLFGVDFFEGDISLIAFDYDLSQVLTNVNNLSYCTRVDRWRGVEQSAIDGEREPVKLEIDKLSNARLLIFAGISVILPVVATLLVALLTKVGYIVGMLLFCLCVLGLSAAVLFVCTYYFNSIIGKRYFKKAEQD